MPLLEYLQAAWLTQRQNQLEVAVDTALERHVATPNCVAVQKEHHATDRNTTVFIQYPTRKSCGRSVHKVNPRSHSTIWRQRNACRSCRCVIEREDAILMSRSNDIIRLTDFFTLTFCLFARCYFETIFVIRSAFLTTIEAIEGDMSVDGKGADCIAYFC